MSEMCQLVLPEGAVIEGLVGEAAPQPQTSDLDRSDPKTPMFQGGYEQVFFRRGTINPLWVYTVDPWPRRSRPGPL